MSDERNRLKETIQEYDPTIIGSDETLPTAVLIPLTETAGNNVEIIFQKRASHLDNQPGDVCFPGGYKNSSDETFRETALRETSEELGLDRKKVSVFGEFDSTLFPWHLEIAAFVGWVHEHEAIDPDRSEVDEVFRVPLDLAMRQEPETYEVEFLPNPSEDFPYEKIPGGKDYDWSPRYLPEVFYEFKGRHVWGITARLLKRFLDVIQRTDSESSRN